MPIEGIIGEQGFERARAKIVEILGTELANQATLQSNPALAVTVWMERVWTFNTEEVPAINVMLGRGDLDGRDMQGTNGSYTFFIDVYSKAATEHNTDEETTEPADKISATLLQRLMGLCRAILENPVYKTLSFAPGLITNTHVRNMQIAQPREDKNAETITMGRIEFVVNLRETNNLIPPNTIESWKTTVKLSETEKGYYWEANNPGESS